MLGHLPFGVGILTGENPMDSAKPEENGVEVLDAAVADNDALSLEHPNLLF